MKPFMARPGTFFSLFIIVAVCLLSYANTFHVPFQFDDPYNINEKPFVRNINSFFEPSAVSPDSVFIMRPVTYFTLAVNYHLYDKDVVGYHIVNLTIHILNGFLVYFLLHLTFKTPFFSNPSVPGGNVTPPPPAPPLKVRGGRGSYDLRGRVGFFIPLFAALLFVSHPIQTQAVTYIIQRAASLATLFYLLSLVMYIKWRLSSNENNPTLPPLNLRGGAEGLRVQVVKRGFVSLTKRFFLYAISLLSAVLAMKTKEIAFTLPVIIVLYESMFFEGPVKKRILFLVPLLLTMVIIPWSLIGMTKPVGEVIGDVSEATRLQTDITRWDYLFTEFRVIVTYIRLLLFPVKQNLDYDYSVYHSFFDPNVFLSFLFLLALFWTGIYLFYRLRVPPHPPLI